MVSPILEHVPHLPERFVLAEMQTQKVMFLSKLLFVGSVNLTRIIIKLKLFKSKLL